MAYTSHRASKNRRLEPGQRCSRCGSPPTTPQTAFTDLTCDLAAGSYVGGVTHRLAAKGEAWRVDGGTPAEEWWRILGWEPATQKLVSAVGVTEEDLRE